MALKTNTFEGGSNGVTISTANSGGTSGNAFDAITGTLGKFSTTSPMHGSVCAQFAGTSTSDHLDYTFTATQLAVRAYYSWTTAPGGTAMRPLDIRTSSISVIRMTINSSQQAVFSTNNGGTTLKTYTTAFATNTQYRIEVVTTNGNAANATIKIDIYAGDSGTPIETGFSTTTGTTGATGNITRVQFGHNASTTYTGTMRIDGVAAQDATTTYIGPESVPGSDPPIADAGPGQSSLKPFNTCTLDFSGSTPDTGRTITTYTPTQTSGPAVTLDMTDPVHPEFEVPGTPSGTTITVSLVVTDDLDVDSVNASSVDILCLAHSMFLIRATPEALKGVPL